MAESRHDYGPAHRIQAEAIGEPGRRTFRILVANARAAASLWFEKEDLANLGAHIEAWLARLSDQKLLVESDSPDPNESFTGEPGLDFRIARLALGYDERERVFLLLAYAADDRDDDRPTFSCQATAGQFRALAEEIRRVVAAGRPLCRLCGLPIDRGGHACVRANGHLKQPIPPLQNDDD